MATSNPVENPVDYPVAQGFIQDLLRRETLWRVFPYEVCVGPVPDPVLCRTSNMETANALASRPQNWLSWGMGNPAHRPSIFTAELAASICERIASGESVRQVCRDPAMPGRTTVNQWVDEDREGFASQYARAREKGWLALAEETLEIADDGTNDWQTRELESGRIDTVPDSEHVTRSRLRVDTRKWLLSKMLPVTFGDRQLSQNQTLGADGKPIDPVQPTLTVTIEGGKRSSDE